jgi:N-methylhydantoinase B
MVSLLLVDGSLLMGGVGFLHHLTSASEVRKSIIRFRRRHRRGTSFCSTIPTPPLCTHPTFTWSRLSIMTGN